MNYGKKTGLLLSTCLTMTNSAPPFGFFPGLRSDTRMVGFAAFVLDALLFMLYSLRVSYFWKHLGNGALDHWNYASNDQSGCRLQTGQ